MQNFHLRIFKRGLIASCLILSALIAASPSCKKEWLDEKPQLSLAMPTTLSDYRAMLSTTVTRAPGFNDFYGMFVEYASGDFWVLDQNYEDGDPIDRNAYSWASDFYGGPNSGEWTSPYQQIYYTNIVLEGIEKLIPATNSEQLEWNQIKANALFFRAFSHYDIARQFCKPYNEPTASSDLGIPLKLQSDFNEVSVRASVEETYEQIVSDLIVSASLLSVETPINDLYKCQPNKAAVYAMLGRVYLSMSKYDSAFIYADKSLNLYNTLLDYNDPSVNPASTSVSFQRFNPEMLFYKRGNQQRFLARNRLIVDSTLYRMYNSNDKRQDVFFTPVGAHFTFTGTYDGTSNQLFVGLATDEVYLIRAECHARLGRKDEALNDLNTLLKKRWKAGVTFPAVSATDVNDAIRKILLERRKELCFRSLRWEDLRRLNMDSAFTVTLAKVINGQMHSLPPNSPLYVLPIPDIVIQLTRMPQNER